MIKIIFGRILLEYLRFFAKIRLNIDRPDIIGITGSAGKSSTRKAITAVLEKKYVVKTTEHGNSESGIPLDILSISSIDYSLISWIMIIIIAPFKAIFSKKNSYEKYVVEMGIDSPNEPKNMGYLLKIIKPTTGIFINANLVHAMQFDHLTDEKDGGKRKEKIMDLIAEEKGKLITTLPEEGIAILNIDDRRVKSFINKTLAKVVTVGKSKDANIRIIDTKISLSGFICKYEVTYGEVHSHITLSIPKQLFGEKYATTFGLAIATGLAKGIAIKEILDALEEYSSEPGRMSLYKGINNSKIIDSTYNASLETMLDAIDTLKQISQNRKKFVLLGDMRELGQEAEREHKTLAEEVIKVADKIYLVGENMKKYFLPHATSKGYNKNNILHFENAIIAGEYICNELHSNSIILIKGSQNTIFLEEAVRLLLANKEDSAKLCRNDEYWRRVKEKYFNINKYEN